MQDVLLKINGRGILWQSFDDIQELLIDLPGTAEITFGRPKATWHAMAMAHQWEVEGSCCCCFWLRSPSLAIGEKGRFWVPTTKARLINYDQLMFYWAGGFAFLIGIILTYFSGPFYQSSSCLRLSDFIVYQSESTSCFLHLFDLCFYVPSNCQRPSTGYAHHVDDTLVRKSCKSVCIMYAWSSLLCMSMRVREWSNPHCLVNIFQALIKLPKRLGQDLERLQCWKSCFQYSENLNNI